MKHFPVHFFWALFSISLQNFAYISFIKWPENSAEIFNKIFSQLQKDDRKRKMFEMNKQELLAMSIGVLIYITNVVLVGVLALDDSRPQLFYSAIPEKYQSNLTFSVLLVLEALCVTYFCTIGYFVLLTHIMFFEMANGYLKDAEETTKRKVSHFSLCGAIKACKEVRRLQLLIQIFNQSNCFLIFSFKIHCLSSGIVGGFFTIRHSYEEPQLGLIAIWKSSKVFQSSSIIMKKRHSQRSLSMDDASSSVSVAKSKFSVSSPLTSISLIREMEQIWLTNLREKLEQHIITVKDLLWVFAVEMFLELELCAL
ncbi:unnamed protein product [Allacma fusca]|uniref:Uncharacterized protein n=1 Tax=Allacma fusca TaxID=39272 RepID=A0A8J2LHT7_9HEXA|nr:unnamed protein product [Allacma fusca]